MNIGLFFFGFLLFLTSLFMIMIILVQRGRGGGLTASLGGSGGQSAFGAKAGDTFTRITVVTAIIWILLCMLTIKIYNPVHPPAAKTDLSISAGAGAADLPEEGDASGSGDIDENGAVPANPDLPGESSPQEKGKSESASGPVPPPAEPGSDDGQ